MTTCSCHLLVDALAAGNAARVFGVPGDPVTHCCDLLAAGAIYEQSINEAVALEGAVGLSACGHRAAVVIKQAGVNVAQDALANALYHTVGAGIVVVVGDDLGPRRSTYEQDTRALARTLGVPVFDAVTSEGMLKLVLSAFSLSECARIPVVVRVTSALHELSAAYYAPHRETGAVHRADAPQLEVQRDVAFGLSKRGRHQHYNAVTMPAVRDWIRGASLATRRCGDDCRRGVIAVGDSARLVSDETSVGCRLNLSVAWPLPSAVGEFCAEHRSLLVVEEPWSVVEREIRAFVGSARGCRVLGRDTNHLPPRGRLEPGDVEAAITRLHIPEVAPRNATPELGRRPVDDSHPYRSVFTAIAILARDGAFVAVDVGSASRLCYPPYAAADVALSLGSPIAVAAGAARSDRPAIAVIGDYGFLHSGLQGLIEAVHRELSLVVVVLANEISAQTGGQLHHATRAPANPRRPIDLAAVVRGIGVDGLVEWAPETSAPELVRCLNELLGRARPQVCLALQSPPTHDR